MLLDLSKHGYFISKSTLMCLSQRTDDGISQHTDDDLPYILLLLLGKGTTIRTLDLSRSNFTSAGINYFAAALKDQQIQISTLILRDNKLPDITLRLLLDIPGIKELDLSNTGISDDQLLELRRLPTDCKLDNLILHDCKFSTYAINEIGNVNLSIERIALDGIILRKLVIGDSQSRVRNIVRRARMIAPKLQALSSLPDDSFTENAEDSSKKIEAIVAIQYQRQLQDVFYKTSGQTFFNEGKPPRSDGLEAAQIFNDRNDSIFERKRLYKNEEKEYLIYLKYVQSILKTKKTMYGLETFFGLVQYFNSTKMSANEKWSKIASQAQIYVENKSLNKDSFSYKFASAISIANNELNSRPLAKLEADKCLSYLTDQLSFRMLR